MHWTSLSFTYFKRSYFRWGEISRKCWQDISQGGNFHETTPISFINAYGFYFRVGVISRRRKKREKRENYPHANVHVYSTSKNIIHHGRNKIVMKYIRMILPIS